MPSLHRSKSSNLPGSKGPVILTSLPLVSTFPVLMVTFLGGASKVKVKGLLVSIVLPARGAASKVTGDGTGASTGLTDRKPTFAVAVLGENCPTRLATRNISTSLCQPPPRNTRSLVISVK